MLTIDGRYFSLDDINTPRFGKNRFIEITKALIKPLEYDMSCVDISSNIFQEQIIEYVKNVHGKAPEVFEPYLVGALAARVMCLMDYLKETSIRTPLKELEEIAEFAMMAAADAKVDSINGLLGFERVSFGKKISILMDKDSMDRLSVYLPSFISFQ
jgi:hypothetical protein